jgi:hypothetical protein
MCNDIFDIKFAKIAESGYIIQYRERAVGNWSIKQGIDRGPKITGDKPVVYKLIGVKACL